MLFALLPVLCPRRESARRMRAKRNEEVKQLETTLNQLQDRNEQLEAQNKDYANCLQQLQQEMRSLRSQLQQASVASSQHQQQSSSEVHQVSLRCVVPAHMIQNWFCHAGRTSHGSTHACMRVCALELRPSLHRSSRCCTLLLLLLLCRC
jgi:uncharacterized phage infection (PIP) family protein YhgE